MGQDAFHEAFMGTGEPLANDKARIGAVSPDDVAHPDWPGTIRAGITVSRSAGAGINQLAEQALPVRVALKPARSRRRLHEPAGADQHPRTVGQTVEAAWATTHRSPSAGLDRVRHEAGGINDQGWRADLLADALTSYGDWGWVVTRT